MATLVYLLALSRAVTATVVSNLSSSYPLIVANIIAGQPLDGFVSFSIEFSSFPDFAGKSCPFHAISAVFSAHNAAGNVSSPNRFSNNLLNNLGYLTGTKPYIRVGGNTQDYAIYNPNLTIALNGTINATRSPDYPTTIEIGQSYFESYLTWPNVKFSHGFNMGGNHDDRQWATLIQTAEIACKTLGKEKLYWWEYGNEPDLFATSSQGPVRPPNYNESDYVTEWLAATRAIQGVIAEFCPDLLSNDTYGYIAPSFAGVANHLKAPLAWADGLNTDGTVRYFSTHK